MVLDPNVHGTLTIVLDDVPWDQALGHRPEEQRPGAANSKAMSCASRPLTLEEGSRTRGAPSRNRKLSRSEKVTVTRFLSYAHSKDVVPTIKKFLRSAAT